MYRYSKALFILFGLALVLSMFQPTAVLAQGDAQSPARAGRGVITGRLGYPSEMIPAMTIYAFEVGSGWNSYTRIQTVQNQTSYTISGLEPGRYYVVGYFQGLAGGYTEYVKCGYSESCTNHSLAAVRVRAGRTSANVDVTDWILPASSVPAQPVDQPETTCSTYHRVQRKETLYKIGRLYGVSWLEIAEANNLANPNRIYAGQVLCIPGVAEDPGEEPEVVPSFSIVSVVRDRTVTIQTANFPANTKFVVRMSGLAARGVNGLVVTSLNSGKGGSFQATFEIPETMRGRQRIAIRLESATGYYSYNWFYNRTAR